VYQASAFTRCRSSQLAAFHCLVKGIAVSNIDERTAGWLWHLGDAAGLPQRVIEPEHQGDTAKNLVAVGHPVDLVRTSMKDEMALRIAL